MSETNLKLIPVENLTCQDCGGYADFVVVHEDLNFHHKDYEFLCKDCLKSKYDWLLGGETNKC